MSDFICTKYDCPNRTSLGYCRLTACSICGQMCPQTRWTDKLSLDDGGNIRDFAGNVVGHYGVGMLQDYTAIAIKENTDGTK